MKGLGYRSIFVLAAVIVGGCHRGGGGGGGGAPPASPTAWELGSGNHTPASVAFTTVGLAGNGLAAPRDLAFNPLVPDELWVVNYTDSSALIISNASTPGRTFLSRLDSHANHFMPYPSALAFGGSTTTFGIPGTFATSAESNNGGNYFMGPTLWSSDLSVFAVQDPNGLGSHIDMLHCSPYAMGIAWQGANVYWVFGGYMSDIVKYDFQIDHGIGNDDHSDGQKYHYVAGLVKRTVGVPSHLAYDSGTGLLYIADTGNSRIAVLDTNTGSITSDHAGPDPVLIDKNVTGATLTTLVSGLNKPCGLELHNGLLYVSEYGTGVISAYTLAGVKVNWLDTGVGANRVMGLNFGPDGKLYFVDNPGNRVLRIDP